MHKIGIIFCEVCKSTMVDSGFKSQSTLRCCSCGNEETFRVGKVSIEDKEILNQLVSEAKKDAAIE